MKNPRALAAVSALLAVLSGCSETPSGRPATKIKRDLDLNGPDIGINEDRLLSSVRVVTNATVSQAEVDEGCAGDRTGRTLIRFDVMTPNNGPGDLDIGAVACQSTRSDAVCEGVTCTSDPSCCCGGTYECQTSGEADLGEFFEFNCAHGHIHFTSFAEYRLLTPEGDVAAAGHKQSFCLMDLATIPGQSCDFQYSCGNQGISAGCADVYGSALPCSYVDVTDVPDGEYVIEVTMDPLDVIDESNEGNNIGTATVTLDVGNVPPPPPPDVHRFLIRDGFGDEEETHEYYHSLEAEVEVHPGDYTLPQFIIESMGVSEERIDAQYRNVNELGVWRDMTCTPTIARGAGGCFVSNRENPEDEALLGTVAMRLDSLGITQFFAFDGDGRLVTSAVLDDEGPKFLPRLCTNCHGGEYDGVQPDLGSIWREFEPSRLLRHPDDTQQQAEQNWFDLNQAIRTANAAVRSEDEGGPFGVDRFKANQERYIEEMYPEDAPPAIDSEAVGHMPLSWQGDEVREDLWSQTVNPYCMTCHRSNQFDFTNYFAFASLAAPSNGSTLLRRYIDEDPQDPNRANLPFMPQSQIQWSNLNNDAEALISIDTWLGVENNLAPVADAGADRVVPGGVAVSLSAVGSSDPDEDPLNYQWEVIEGLAVEFSPSPNARDVTFTVPEVEAPTDLVVQLRVTDPHLAFHEDTVTISVVPDGGRYELSSSDTPLEIPDGGGGQPGVALSTIEADEDFLITDASITVDITHTWIGDLQIDLIAPDGSTHLLRARSGGNADDINESYLVPALIGSVTQGAWQLRVSDHAGEDVGGIEAWSFDFGVTPRPENLAPVARISGPLLASSGAEVELDGSESDDPDGDTLAFAWRVLEGPQVELVPSADGQQVSFTAPEVQENTDITIELTVTDGGGGESRDSFSVTVEPATGGLVIVHAQDVPMPIPDNNPDGVTSTVEVVQDIVIADLHVDLTIDHTYRGDLIVVLQGPGDFEAVLHNGSGGSADNIHQSISVPAAVDRRSGGTWRLHVSDHAALDLGVVQAWSLRFAEEGAQPNEAPIAVVTPSEQTVQPGAMVALSAVESSDPDGHALSYEWTVLSGPEVDFSPSAQARDVAFVAPEASGETEFLIGLTVRDAPGREDTAQTVVVVSNTRLVVSSSDTPLDIPDNDPEGVSSTIDVDDERTIDSLSVSLEIDHTWRGDLRVVLQAPDGSEFVLHDRTGGSLDNLYATYAVSVAADTAATGAWSLVVDDDAGQDVGTLNTWELDFLF